MRYNKLKILYNTFAGKSITFSVFLKKFLYILGIILYNSKKDKRIQYER